MTDRILAVLAVALFVAFISPLIGKALDIRQGVPLLVVLVLATVLASVDFWFQTRRQRRSRAKEGDVKEDA